jgi:predicted dehydrogenase
VERYRGTLMVGFNMRFRPAFRELEEIVSSGRLGTTIGYFCSRLGPGAGLGGRAFWKSWRTQPGLACGMTVESLSHDIDMMLALVGPVVDVFAGLRSTMEDLPEFDNTANVVMNLKSGGTAAIQASWASHLGFSRRSVIGRDGAAAVEGSDTWDFQRVTLKTGDMAYETTRRFDDRLDGTSYREENRHFAECVAAGTAPRLTARDGLRAMLVADAIRRADAHHTVVEVEQI